MTLDEGQPLVQNATPQSGGGGADMEWSVVEDKRNPGEWRVEALDFDNEGAVYVTIFAGPEAQDRANEYAEWKNAQQHRLARKVG